MKTNKFLFFATGLILITAAICVTLHFLMLQKKWLPLSFGQSPIVEMYLFLVPASLLTIWFVNWRYTKDHTSAGRSYFVTVFFKMFGSAAFLYPGVVVPPIFFRETVIQFMVIFFILLFIETLLLVRLLNLPVTQIPKNDENQ